MRKLRCGIMGPGKIAQNKIATALARNKNVILYAVGSKDLKKANDFAKEFGFEKAYGSYEEMVKDPNLDVVYIATLNSFHYENIKLCLENNKHVICEKPFTINTKEAEEVIKLAEEKKLFLMEAMWSRFLPGTKKLKEVLCSGSVGKIKTLTVTLGFNNDIPRLIKREFGGGALLDLGVYILHFIVGMLGAEIEEIKTIMIPTPTEVDGQAMISFRYKDGTIATAHCSITADYTNEAVFYGDAGRIVVPRFSEVEIIKVFRNTVLEPTVYYVPYEGTGFEYQIKEAVDSILSGRTEPDSLTHAETLAIMRLMDKIREIWDLKYPADIR